MQIHSINRDHLLNIPIAFGICKWTNNNFCMNLLQEIERVWDREIDPAYKQTWLSFYSSVMLFPQVDIDFISLFDMRNQIEYPSDIYAAANKKSHPKECDIKFCWYILEVALPILSHAHYIDPTFPSYSQYTPWTLSLTVQNSLKLIFRNTVLTHRAKFNCEFN